MVLKRASLDQKGNSCDACVRENYPQFLCNFLMNKVGINILLSFSHCKKSWRSSSTPASGDAGPIHTGVEKSFRHTWRKFYYKYRTFSTEFFKCRTSSAEMDCLKSNITWARTYVFRFTFQYSTTAPHFLMSLTGGPTWNSHRQLESKLVRRQLYNSAKIWTDNLIVSIL